MKIRNYHLTADTHFTAFVASASKRTGGEFEAMNDASFQHSAYLQVIFSA
jgi:hypothetical protein